MRISQPERPPSSVQTWQAAAGHCRRRHGVRYLKSRNVIAPGEVGAEAMAGDDVDDGDASAPPLSGGGTASVSLPADLDMGAPVLLRRP